MKRTYKNIHTLAKKVGNHSQLTLENILHCRANIKGACWCDINNLMTPELSVEIAGIFGGRADSQKKIASVLRRGGAINGWFLGRVIYCNVRKRFSYVAGQDHSSELRQIRKELLKYW